MVGKVDDRDSVKIVFGEIAIRLTFSNLLSTGVLSYFYNSK